MINVLNAIVFCACKVKQMNDERGYNTFQRGKYLLV